MLDGSGRSLVAENRPANSKVRGRFNHGLGVYYTSRYWRYHLHRRNNERRCVLRSIDKYSIDKSEVIFQHDYDPKHTSKKAKKCLEDLKLRVLKWPAQSPYLNPIEHLWDSLKRKLAGYPEPSAGVHDLWNRTKAEWLKLSRDECLKLVESMPKRIRAVLKAKGGPTKY